MQDLYKEYFYKNYSWAVDFLDLDMWTVTERDEEERVASKIDEDDVIEVFLP